MDRSGPLNPRVVDRVDRNCSASRPDVGGYRGPGYTGGATAFGKGGAQRLPPKPESYCILLQEPGAGQGCVKGGGGVTPPDSVSP